MPPWEWAAPSACPAPRSCAAFVADRFEWQPLFWTSAVLAFVVASFIPRQDSTAEERSAADAPEVIAAKV